VATHSTDALDESTDTPPRRRPRRTDWRLGGRSTARWRGSVLAAAIIALGVGVLGGGILSQVLPGGLAGVAATALLWAAMLAVVVWALLRGRPVYLLSFRFTDLVWGIGLGVFVRMCQGWFEIGTGGSGALPSYPTISGQLPSGWLFTDVVATVAIAPVLEEFFFRAVILVTIYTLLRRRFGGVTAGIVAGLVSVGLFVLAHVLVAPLAADVVLSLALLGVICAALVLLTGRIWGAVLVHVVFNGTYVLLALAGTFFG
jgi:membrane protease YdiL (CAAX protease family)